MKQKVLLVEHSQPVQLLIKSRLSEEPLDLHVVDTADAGLQAAAQLKPDLILLDADLPTVGGFNLCRELKADPVTTAIPVIFLINATSSSNRLEGLEAGAVDFVAKPFDPAELRARVRAALRTKFLMDLLAGKAMVDGLTGLWNRTYLEQRVTSELATLNRTGRSFACILTDVDNFRSINGRYGHPFGDEVLRTIGILFMEDCRTEDVVCRIGPDRFAILTPGVDANGAAMLSERLRQNVEKINFSRHAEIIQATCSFGIAGPKRQVVTSIITAAETALAQSKSAGGNQISTDEAAERCAVLS